MIAGDFGKRAVAAAWNSQSFDVAGSTARFEGHGNTSEAGIIQKIVLRASTVFFVKTLDKREKEGMMRAVIGTGLLRHVFR